MKRPRRQMVVLVLVVVLIGCEGGTSAMSDGVPIHEGMYGGTITKRLEMVYMPTMESAVDQAEVAEGLSFDEQGRPLSGGSPMKVGFQKSEVINDLNIAMRLKAITTMSNGVKLQWDMSMEIAVFHYEEESKQVVPVTGSYSVVLITAGTDALEYEGTLYAISEDGKWKCLGEETGLLRR